MLKKNLHYLIRCSFLLMIICAALVFNSCHETAEDYFLFLKSDCEYSLTVYVDEERVAECNFCLIYGDGKSEGEMAFTYPEPLKTSKVSVKFSGDGEEYIYNGKELEGYAIPPLWREVYELFLPCESVMAARNTGGVTVIEASRENDGKSIFYTLNGDGNPTEIRHGNIKVELKSIEKEVTE